MTGYEISDTGLPSDWLKRAAELHAQRPALIIGSTTLRYGVLLQRLAGLAARLAECGLEQGSPFAIVSNRSDRIAWALYLALYTGAPLWPLDIRRGELRRELSMAGIRHALVDEGVVLPDGIHRIPSELLDRPIGCTVPQPRVAEPSRILLILATSGSTGVARGVMLTAANLAAAVQASRRRLDLRAGDIWLACLPLYHVGGVSILLRALEAGGCVVLHQGFEAARVWDALLAQRVTHLSLVPAMLRALLEHIAFEGPPPSIRAVVVGGGPLDAALVDRALDAGWPICPSYGLSENASQVATLCPATRGWSAGDVGPPLEGVGVDIVDQQGRPTSGQGRIRIAGPSVMAGYLNADWRAGDGLTEGRFTTSDLGFVDQRGCLHVLGRVDDVIISGGENVMPQQVEALVRGCSGVADVAVVGVNDVTWGQRVTALFAGEIDAVELERWCRAHIPAPLRPRTFVKLDGLPRNAMGKLDRQALQRRAQDQLR